MDNPTKSSWMLGIRLPQGNQISPRVRSGWDDGRDTVARHERNPEGTAWITTQERIERIPNPVVYASLKYARCSRGRSAVNITFADADEPDHILHTNLSGLDQILLALGTGHLQYRDGCIIGRFTFVKRSTEVSIIPYLPVVSS